MCRHLLICALAGLSTVLWFAGGCADRQDEPNASAPAPRADSTSIAEIDDVPPAPYDARPGEHAAEDVGRPLVGMAWAFPAVAPLSPLTEAERAMLGEYRDALPAMALPDIGAMQLAIVRWPDLDGQAHVAWQLRAHRGEAYVTPWMEVLAGPAPEVQAVTAEEAMEAWTSGFADQAGAPSLVLQGEDSTAWGIAEVGASSALAAVIWARLGRADQAEQWAQRAGRAGFDGLPAAMAYKAHRMALEGLPWGFDRRVSARLLAAALGLSASYAGKARLAEDQAIMLEMVRQDSTPPAWGEEEPEGTLPWARYQAWRLRDAGLPPGMEYTLGAGDPVIALINGGDSVRVAAREMLSNRSFTRVLATDHSGPVPDLLRIGDLAYDVLSAETGRHHLDSRGVTRLFALDAEDREAVAAEISAELGLRVGE